MRVYAPLPRDHHLVTDGWVCGICQKPFRPGQRTTVAPARPKNPLLEAESVPAVPLHASCAFNGMTTSRGMILQIKDGDASPYPVWTDRGQFTLEEVGLAEGELRSTSARPNQEETP